ncbi:MAG: DNA translocase FtsK 4TM domain-containing protein, partial [Bacteroidota bacterium]
MAAVRRPVRRRADAGNNGAQLEQRREIAGILLVFLAAAGLWTLWSGNAERGLVVRCLSAACAFLAGRTLSFLPLIYLLAMGVYLILRRRRPDFLGPWLGITFFCLVILGGFDLIERVADPPDLLTSEGGGVLGGLVALLARTAFTTAGAWLFLVALSLVALLLCTGKPLVHLLAASRQRTTASLRQPPAPEKQRRAASPELPPTPATDALSGRGP